MFTGIVHDRGTVASFKGGRLVVESALEPEIGDSIAVDGGCLTVTARENGLLAFDVMEKETLARAKPSAARSTGSPRCAQETRSAAITSRGTWTASAASARARVSG